MQLQVYISPRIYLVLTPVPEQLIYLSSLEIGSKVDRPVDSGLFVDSGVFVQLGKAHGYIRVKDRTVQ